MIYPTIKELTKDEFNRYELSIATAKCARVVTDEYVATRNEAVGHRRQHNRLLRPQLQHHILNTRKCENTQHS